jgi:hypothetical protein
MGAAALAAEHAARLVAPGMHTPAQAIRLAAAIGTGLVVLALAAKLLRIRQFDAAAAVVVGRLRSRPAQ